jgi:HEAT repeat protein
MRIPVAALIVTALASGCSTTGNKNAVSDSNELRVTSTDSVEIKRKEAKELFENWVHARANARHFRRPDSNNLYIQLILHPYGEEQFLKGLHHKKPWIRDLSEAALAGRNSDEFRKQMSILAVDGGEFEREKAIKALSSTRDPRTAVVLIERLHNDPWAQNRQNSAHHLRYFKSEEAIQALLLSLNDEMRVAATSLQTLGIHEEEKLVLHGKEALSRVEHPQFLGFIVEAYARIGTNEAIDIIVERIGTIDDESWGRGYVRTIKEHWSDPRAKSAPKELKSFIEWWNQQK